MEFFGKAPSTAPTFGRSDVSSSGSLDGLHIQADRGGAVTLTAAPSVSSPRGSPAACGPTTASPGPQSARKPFEQWATTSAIAQAVAVGSCVDAMAAGTKLKNLPGGSASPSMGKVEANEQTNANNFVKDNFEDHSGVTDKELVMGNEAETNNIK